MTAASSLCPLSSKPNRLPSSRLCPSHSIRAVVSMTPLLDSPDFIPQRFPPLGFRYASRSLLPSEAFVPGQAPLGTSIFSFISVSGKCSWLVFETSFFFSPPSQLLSSSNSASVSITLNCVSDVMLPILMSGSSNGCLQPYCMTLWTYSSFFEMLDPFASLM